MLLRQFMTTYVISVYRNYCCEFESCSFEMFSIQHYVIKFVSDVRQVVFSGYSGSSTNKRSHYQLEY